LCAPPGKAGPVVLFGRNRLCALVKPRLAVTADNLLERMLSTDIKLGTSTPQADPSGDYAFDVFARPKLSRPAAARRSNRKPSN
jgi:molybdate transport system substrate-binding protein